MRPSPAQIADPSCDSRAPQRRPVLRPLSCASSCYGANLVIVHGPAALRGAQAISFAPLFLEIIPFSLTSSAFPIPGPPPVDPLNFDPWDTGLRAKALFSQKALGSMCK